MWQKANPVWMRVGVVKSWPCEWFGKTRAMWSDFFVEDIEIRRYIEKTFPRTAISKVVIRKTAKEWEIIIFTSKVGVLMWKQWARIKEFEKNLKDVFDKDFKIIVKEVRNPELSAKIMAEFIVSQLEGRMPYRRVAKNVLQRIMEKWASGAKIQIWWRLNWADIARSEKFIEGRVSLQTFRSDIDYCHMQAKTKYGVLWVKVWIQKWVLNTKSSSSKKRNNFI